MAAYGWACGEPFRDVFVEGVFEAMVNLDQNWRCVRCGSLRVDTANRLLDRGWCFTSVGLVNWGRCRECCGFSEPPELFDVARRWEEDRRRGRSPEVGTSADK